MSTNSLNERLDYNRCVDDALRSATDSRYFLIEEVIDGRPIFYSCIARHLGDLAGSGLWKLVKQKSPLKGEEADAIMRLKRPDVFRFKADPALSLEYGSNFYLSFSGGVVRPLSNEEYRFLMDTDAFNDKA